ncbi:MAG: DUF488 domain-containing protein [Deltaproteobacteria bacterium]|nr:DUF488 domain-containing protein [Deltaproteobacteria bacterium]
MYSVGHSNHPIEKFVALLKSHNITAVADVRSIPYSRRNPQYNKDNLPDLLRQEGIAYVFLGQELGARPKDRSFYVDGAVDFRLLSSGEPFRKGVARLIEGMDRFVIALLCSEKQPLVCHRAILVGRHLKTIGVRVRHILEDGRVIEQGDLERELVAAQKADRDLFTGTMSKEERLEKAYNLQERQICYKVGGAR